MSSLNGYVQNRGLCGVCGKVNFPDKQMARAAVRRLMQNGAYRTDQKGNPLRAYRACDSDSFHIGHSSSLARPNLNDPSLSWVEG